MKFFNILVSLLVFTVVSCKEEVNPPEEAAAAPTSAASGFVEVQEPYKSSSFQIDEGANVYKVTCAICHGVKGLGDGIAGKSLKPKPRNLVEGKWINGGSRMALFKTVTNGIAGTSMAGFKQLPIEKRWAVIHYIRSITNNKVQDDDSKLEEFAKTAK